MDFYSYVPKGLAQNLLWRKQLRTRCQHSVDVRRSMMRACQDDILFFLNGFCWLYEPRPKYIDGVKQPMVFPFITWPHQDPIIRDIRAQLNSGETRDIGVEKSRGEGASWIGVMLALHDWLFDEYASIGLVSRNMDAADSPEDPDSLFWKIDWQLKMLPPFMAGLPDADWKRDRSKHTLVNHRMTSTISAYAATGDVASGGRKKWFLQDELAKFRRGADAESLSSTEPVTDCRLIVSTPKGAEGAYYDVMHQPSNMLRIKMHWTDNISRNRGMYRFVDGVPKAADPKNNPLLDGYDPVSEEIADLFSRLRKKGFELEGKLRSPWYDQRCDRAGSTPQSMAQEYDLDYGGSAYRIFGGDFFKIAEESVCHPQSVGVMVVNRETFDCHYEKNTKGNFSLWCALDHKGRPPKSDYVVSCDIGTGQGGSHTSNSTVEVFDQRTGEQVAEFASNSIAPGDLAELAVAVSKFFHGAYLIWEHNGGPGNAFTKQMVDLPYTFVYRRKAIYSKGGRAIAGKREIGWWTSNSTKEAMLSDLNMAVRTREVAIKSRMMLKECGQYVRDGDKVVFAGSLKSSNPNETGQNHGDRVIAVALGIQAMKDRPITKPSSEGQDPENPPRGTMAYREKMFKEESRKEQEDGWDDRGPDEFVGQRRLGGIESW
ncbi:MAG: hypothetical protein AAGB04_00140 [Pseudomonadota bacterium]